ncbi:MAG: DUF4397 domain-containing protein [bacterium]|nr:DUF4397 domain-containing protein [Candidatus Kapabacteria bacterium]
MPFATLIRSAIASSCMLVAMLLSACDPTEDPRLLNPPLPDSTLFRVVNLTEGEAVYVSVNGLAVAANVPGLEASAYRAILFKERVNILVTRGSRTDTLTDQVLSPGVRVSLFVAQRGNDVSMVLRQAGSLEQQDLIRDGIARAVFINAIPDSLPVTVRSGCQSGQPLFRDAVFGIPISYESKPVDLSLYLFSGTETSPRSSANLPLQAGTITWTAAARRAGVDRFFAIGPTDVTLRELPQESRSQASIEVFNALSGGGNISATLVDRQIANNLGTLELSSAMMVDACRNATGDSLVITPSTGSDVLIPLQMDVGSRTLALVYGTQSGARALSLRLDPPPGVPTQALVRVVNISAVASGGQLQIGAGAPDSLALATSFPFLATGGVSGYLALTPGLYPLLLQESGTGRHLHAGIEQLAAGYHTVIIADRDGMPEMLVLSHDANSSRLGGLDMPGSRVRLFNLLSDTTANFAIGPIQVNGLAYSYTALTVVPSNITSVTTSIGDANVDHSTGSLVIGVTGSSAAGHNISFASPAGSPPTGRASIRILNAVPDIAEFAVDEAVNARFGEPTPSVEHNEGRFSFTIRVAGDTAVVARVSGVELRGGRRYLLVIGPKRKSESLGDKYRALLIQE